MEQVTRTNNDENSPTNDNNNVISLQACKVSKEHKQARKQQNLGTRITADTLERFRKFVLYRHGKMNGPFAQEIENAIEFYMNNQQQTTSLTYSPIPKTGRPRSDRIDKFRQIAIQLQQLTSYPYVNYFTLVHQINSVLGKCDKRTFNKYLTAIRKLSNEQTTPFGIAPQLDVSVFVEKIQSDDW